MAGSSKGQKDNHIFLALYIVVNVANDIIKRSCYAGAIYLHLPVRVGVKTGFTQVCQATQRETNPKKSLSFVEGTPFSFDYTFVSFLSLFL